MDDHILSLNLPILGICYGHQLICKHLGGNVINSKKREFGKAFIKIKSKSKIFEGIYKKNNEYQVWMSHGDSVSRAPEGFSTLARTAGAPVAAFEDVERRLVGVQWHPEVHHTESGQTVLEHFLFDIAGCRPDWNASSIVGDQIAQIRGQVGDRRVICGLSGGVDSAVAAALVQRAVGDQLTCVFVDHGLLRQGEAEQVKNDFVAATGADLVVADESQRFLDALAGVTDPETKRKIIGREFIRTFEDVAKRLNADQPIDFLVQGTLYPDVVESGGGEGAANIKSHHNVCLLYTSDAADE